MSKGSEIQGRRRRMIFRDDSPEELVTMTEASEEEDELEVSTTTTDASIDYAEDTTRPIERLQRRRRRCVYGLRVLTTTTAALAE